MPDTNCDAVNLCHSGEGIETRGSGTARRVLADEAKGEAQTEVIAS